MITKVGLHRALNVPDFHGKARVFKRPHEQTGADPAKITALVARASVFGKFARKRFELFSSLKTPEYLSGAGLDLRVLVDGVNQNVARPTLFLCPEPLLLLVVVAEQYLLVYLNIRGDFRP